MMENSTNGLVAWSATTVYARAVDTLANSTVDFTDFQAWRYKPYVVESDVSKFATPLHSNAATATEGQQLVAQALP
jgi:hypothetical protein